MEVDAPQFNCPRVDVHSYTDVSQVTAEPFQVTEHIKKISSTTPRFRREKELEAALGQIKGVDILGGNRMVFTTRITTTTGILRMDVGLASTATSEEQIQFLSNYDPWSERWYPHTSHLLSMVVIKREVDGGDLYAAQICKAMRKMKLREDESIARFSQEALRNVLVGPPTQSEEDEAMENWKRSLSTDPFGNAWPSMEK